MNLHEYQGKALFAEYNLPVSKGVVIFEPEEALKACRDIGGTKWVVKAQVHAGGRGKAGGVKLVDTPDDAIDFARSWLGKKLVTYQTDTNGQLVNSILVEECTDIDQELYLSAVIDRDSQRIVFIGSSEGGVNIEEVAENTPDKIIYESIDPLCGAQPFQARKIAKILNLNNTQTRQFVPMLQNLTKLFIEKDLALLEINPLVITSGGNLHCLDAKVSIDSNAIYRQPEIAEMHDSSQEDPREAEAARNDLSYVSLDGNIGCMVNGAGLAMGTMDTIKYYGGNPANFLDVGGTATQERVSKAFKIILDDPEVKVVLVNIFGGIVRCDLIAEGVIAAIEEVGVNIPVVVRLEGNNADLGSQILSQAGVKIESINNLADAAKKSVELAK
ncbi:ADP-forming succinate--CoA ligase subunit beta [Gammaproteobacteria bacterium]|jgi:succinyl-CoA synthetase beta subunit|nr:ADP-forming succinate--CoA ligase subunit beta [Gammaproteobacteria bacterium]MDB4135934.1 ADP-forming succinate--CoA ligase subunit beta [Gammaproteobacteria bacterium]MDB9747980.1 ADP-forming succinate--CoA ligase subunit beta [Gammaproteobacteria bacterium]MDC1189335.1 ADP-forming succinate--CoA ligase subunit beta [Gammaproteobacteria bacterium]MDC1535442.1 ADP-forming succinate--CoA ligase subunit beta [Gammaproteobacteria bacterium]|tara:strand:- start:1489 stop:2649 length:1161 start_codon:yes stop_codon:yes gene_type:complete